MGADHGRDAQNPPANEQHARRQLAVGCWENHSWAHLGPLWLWTDRQNRRRLRQGIRHECHLVGIRGWARPRAADGKTIAESREAFFATPDVVSVHVRLKPATKGMITATDLGQMRQDAVFVNTSRAGLIEDGALLNALNAGRPGMAALDVFDREPITWDDDPIANHPNVIARPILGS